MRALFIFYSAALLFFGQSIATAEDFDLGKKGTLSMDLPEGWRAEFQALADVGANVTVRPEGTLNMACKITVLFLPEPKDLTPEETLENWKRTLSPMASGSVEKTPKTIKLQLKKGFGFYAIFTDASLVGKPPEPRNYKISAPGMIKLNKETLLATTLFSDDKDSQEFAALIKMLESVKLHVAVPPSI